MRKMLQMHMMKPTHTAVLMWMEMEETNLATGGRRGASTRARERKGRGEGDGGESASKLANSVYLRRVYPKFVAITYVF